MICCWQNGKETAKIDSQKWVEKLQIWAKTIILLLSRIMLLKIKYGRKWTKNIKIDHHDLRLLEICLKMEEIWHQKRQKICRFFAIKDCRWQTAIAFLSANGNCRRQRRQVYCPMIQVYFFDQKL